MREVALVCPASPPVTVAVTVYSSPLEPGSTDGRKRQVPSGRSACAPDAGPPKPAGRANPT